MAAARTATVTVLGTQTLELLVKAYIRTTRRLDRVERELGIIKHDERKTMGVLEDLQAADSALAAADGAVAANVAALATEQSTFLTDVAAALAAAGTDPAAIAAVAADVNAKAADLTAQAANLQALAAAQLAADPGTPAPRIRALAETPPAPDALAAISRTNAAKPPTSR